VLALFAASVLLSVVSWYTTQQGMALYLSPWFSVLASLGIQSALVLVAWLAGVTRERRAWLVGVYGITAVVSIAFSYVSLHTWFTARERPAVVRRQLYDALLETGGRTQVLLSSAVAEGQVHALALEEMAAAEREHGFVSRSGDADPWLAAVRQSVAEEARGLSTAYPEGAGAGLRHSAFERHARLARQTVARLQDARKAFADLATTLRPQQLSEAQLRAFRAAYDAVPWSEVRDTLHAGPLAIPPVPAYSNFVDETSTSQEDLILAFAGLASRPGARHVTALTLATFIDVVIFLLAWAAGPVLFGSPEERWWAAAANLDSKDRQVFIRGLVARLQAGPRGTAALDAATLSPGERQLCLVMVAHGQATSLEQDGRRLFVIDPAVHERLVEALAERSVALRAAEPVAES
jgi:hypothetical protein